MVAVFSVWVFSLFSRSVLCRASILSVSFCKVSDKVLIILSFSPLSISKVSLWPFSTRSSSSLCFSFSVSISLWNWSSSLPSFAFSRLRSFSSYYKSFRSFSLRYSRLLSWMEMFGLGALAFTMLVMVGDGEGFKFY